MSWRETFRTVKIVVVTAGVTSIIWLVLGLAVIDRDPSPPSGSVTPAETGAIATRPQPGSARTAPRLPPPQIGRLLIPVEGVSAAQLTDTFSQARAGGLRVHDAIDIMAPLGTPVLAVASGRVEKLFVSEGGGNTIYQRSADGTLIFYYAHLDRYAPGLTEGQQVSVGQPIATVGYSGNADPTAPHLHFAIQHTLPTAKWHDPATAINPYPLLTGR